MQENIDESTKNPAKASIYQIGPELVSSSVQTESAMVQDEARKKKILNIEAKNSDGI